MTVSKLIRLPAVQDATGLGRNTIYEAMKRGDFPRPIKIGMRAVAWRISDIEQWVNSRLDVEDQMEARLEHQVRAGRGPVRTGSRTRTRTAARNGTRKDALGGGARGKGRK